MEHDPLRDLFGRAADSPDGQPARDVLEGLQPAMRRARRSRAMRVAGTGLASVVLLGFAISAASGGGDSASDVSIATTPDGSIVLPGPTTAPADGEPTAIDDAETLNQSTSVVEPGPERAPTTTTDPGAANVRDTDVPAITAIPTTSTATTTATTAPPTVASTTTDPTTTTPTTTNPATTTPTTTNPTTTVAALTEVIDTVAGTITVTYVPDRILTVVPDPNPGTTAEVEKVEQSEAKVIFSGASAMQVEIHLEDGQLRPEIESAD